MSQKTRAANASQITTLINDNNTQDITPARVRTVTGDLLDSLGSYQQVTRSALQTIIAGTAIEQKTIYEVSNAIGATKRIIVFGYDSSTISTIAINLTDNITGNYDIDSDVFTRGGATVVSVVRWGTTAPDSLGDDGDGYILINFSDKENNGSFYAKDSGSYSKIAQFNIT